MVQKKHKLHQFLDTIPSWVRRYNSKYQLRAVVRMNALLKERGLSQKEVAERAGWTEGYVSRLLTGKQNLTFKTLARFEDAVDADVLMVTRERSGRVDWIEYGVFHSEGTGYMPRVGPPRIENYQLHSVEDGERYVSGIGG
jgi:transcriptional regulator with XRE-family HTH domain